MRRYLQIQGDVQTCFPSDLSKFQAFQHIFEPRARLELHAGSLDVTGAYVFRIRFPTGFNDQAESAEPAKVDDLALQSMVDMVDISAMRSARARMAARPVLTAVG
jgi:hypothetical protein